MFCCLIDSGLCGPHLRKLAITILAAVEFTKQVVRFLEHCFTESKRVFDIINNREKVFCIFGFSETFLGPSFEKFYHQKTAD
jgi:hypothetical protein